MPTIDYTLPLDQLPDPLPIEPLCKPFEVTITPPGSKSITCRAYVLAALAKGESKIIRPLRADDADHLLNALCELGAEARWVPGESHDGEDVCIKGVDGRFPRGGNLYMGDGGTPTRFMIACACLAAEPVTIDASPRMRERPIAEGVQMLRQLGARIEYVEEEGRLPVRVVPSEMLGGRELILGQTSSSQFVSAIMLIASCLNSGIRIRCTAPLTSASYVDLTGQVLADWGVIVDPEFSGAWCDSVARGNSALHIAPQSLTGRMFSIEPDVSSMVYWTLATVLVASNSKVHVPGFHWPSLQPDSLLLHHFGGNGMSIAHDRGDHVRFVGRHVIRGFEEVDAAQMPDGAIALAIAAANARGGRGRNRITGLRTLRVKETDRIAALANELRKVGCTVETGEDWICITPPEVQDGAAAGPTEPRSEPRAKGIEPVVIETYNDHRMAMAFAILGLVRPAIAIKNPKCVAKSYPGFWRDFAKLYAD